MITFIHYAIILSCIALVFLAAAGFEFGSRDPNRKDHDPPRET